MTSFVHADTTIETPGTHPTANFLGLTINTDTVLTTVIAAVIVIGLGLIAKRVVTSEVPRGPQLFFETVYKWAQDQVRENIGPNIAPYVVPLALVEFVFILVCNWISVLPVQVNGKDLAPPPTADVNLTAAMMVLVFVWIQVAGFRANGLRYFGHIARGPGGKMFLAPINVIIELIANPLALALRLFGNIFAGTIMVSVIGLLPAYLLWAPNFGWKLFDMAIGLIQAFVFALLTILYFGQATATGHSESAASH
ncbi:MAG TPA: F0F1 ATP synthase subunit A [Pseudonocardiaceae bacterium]|nr:F0F1 ATP synthase subunit A [Pseudonocardiaceae bacterium]